MAELRLDNYERAQEERAVRLDRARSHRGQDSGARRDGGQPPGSGFPQQPGRLRRREHAADGESRQRAAAPHRPRRRTAGTAADSRRPICGRCCAMTPDRCRSEATKTAAATSALRELPSIVPAVGDAARRALFLGNDVGVRAARQHLRLRPHRRRARTPATASSRSSSPSSCSAAGRWCCTTTSAAACASLAGRDEQRLKDMVDARQPQGRRSQRAPERSVPRRSRLLDRFVRNNLMAAEADRLSLAVIIDQASYVFPSGEPGRLSAAGVVAARDDAQLGDQSAREAAEHGVRAGGREAAPISASA